MTSTQAIKELEIVHFNGQECAPLENGTLSLLIARSVGPRILSLRFEGGENLLAELPDFVTECPGKGPFHFYGGHRLWHAPEELGRTYLPDDSPVEISPVKNGYLITQDVEVKTGLQKSIEVCLQDDPTRVVVRHQLTNRGLWPVTCAPWAITQFKVGGVAILPQASEATGVLPNRSLVLWPYTDPSDPHVCWGRQHIVVNANVAAPFKVGFPNPRGWLAYWLNGVLFVKRASYEAQSSYYDFGSSSEFYCSDKFVELETLAPIHSITPSTSVVHVETWELYGDIDRPRDENDARALTERLGLG